jgi:hypothetical protein
MGFKGSAENVTPIEAALHFCETCRESVLEAQLAVAAIRDTIERLHETRRRTEEILANFRRRPE